MKLLSCPNQSSAREKSFSSSSLTMIVDKHYQTTRQSNIVMRRWLLLSFPYVSLSSTFLSTSSFMTSSLPQRKQHLPTLVFMSSSHYHHHKYRSSNDDKKRRTLIILSAFLDNKDENINGDAMVDIPNSDQLYDDKDDANNDKEWIPFVDTDNTGLIYYYNPSTNVSAWSIPTKSSSSLLSSSSSSPALLTSDMIKQLQMKQTIYNDNIQQQMKQQSYEMIQRRQIESNNLNNLMIKLSSQFDEDDEIITTIRNNDNTNSTNDSDPPQSNAPSMIINNTIDNDMNNNDMLQKNKEKKKKSTDPTSWFMSLFPSNMNEYFTMDNMNGVVVATTAKKSSSSSLEEEQQQQMAKLNERVIRSYDDLSDEQKQKYAFFQRVFETSNEKANTMWEKQLIIQRIKELDQMKQLQQEQEQQSDGDQQEEQEQEQIEELREQKLTSDQSGENDSNKDVTHQVQLIDNRNSITINDIEFFVSDRVSSPMANLVTDHDTNNNWDIVTTTKTISDGMDEDTFVATTNSTMDESISINTTVQPIILQPKVVHGSYVMPHPAKISWGGEDAYMFTNTDNNDYVFGIFDGVSGAEKEKGLPLYSITLANEMKHIVTKDDRNEEMNVQGLIRSLTKAADIADTVATGASTAIVGSVVTRTIQKKDNIIHEAKLNVLNVGDSTCLVMRRYEDSMNNRYIYRVIKRTDDISHYFECPYQLSIDSPDRPRDGTKLFNYPLFDHDIILMGSDGIFDNLFDDNITQIVSQTLLQENNDQSQFMSLLAEQISLEARKVSLITNIKPKTPTISPSFPKFSSLFSTTSSSSSSSAVDSATTNDDNPNNDQRPSTPYAILAQKYGDPDFRYGKGGKVDDISCIAIQYRML